MKAAHNASDHQKKQIEVIDRIEQLVAANSIVFSTVSPVDDYANDPRICLTSVHLPGSDLISAIINTIINPLKILMPGHHYYGPSSLHMTVKNIKVISEPPNFSESDIIKSKDVFNRVAPLHSSFTVYFYRLLLFPANVALIGTTDPELDNIISHLDRELNTAGIPDDKKYSNKDHFFCNMTLCRFTSPITEEFRNKISELSGKIEIPPYKVDSVTLLTCNAVFNQKRIIGRWELH